MKKWTILVDDQIPEFKKRINYVLDFIAQHPLTNKSVLFSKNKNSSFDIQLSYGSQKDEGGYVPAQKVFFSNSIPSFEKLVSNTYTFDSFQIFSVELHQKTTSDFFRNHQFQFDIFETIFFHISRFEEWFYADGRKDEHGRMDGEQQFLVKNQLQQIPVVDHLIVCFLKALGIPVKDKKTTFRITHDIDFIVRRNDFFGVAKSLGGAILKRRNLKSAFRIWQNRQVYNPYDTFDWMLCKNEEVEKTIYFLVNGNSKFDNSYGLNLLVVEKAIQLSRERNYKIGIHPSYHTWKNKNLFEQERQKLEQRIGEPVEITRQHFLRFDFPHTLRIIRQLGMKEDSSLGFADRIGFRCGTGYGYHLYDFENERAYEFIEVPLVFMDSALLSEAAFNTKNAKALWDRFLQKNNSFTKITFNFHNSRFYDTWLQGIPLKRWYEKLINNKL